MITPSASPEMKTAAILLSRQPMRPSLSDAWVRQSVKAVNWIKENGCALAGSVGMQTWEMVLSLASMKDVPIRLYVPLSDCDDSGAAFAAIAQDFNLQDSLCDFVRLPDSIDAKSANSAPAVRDERIVAEADTILPISIRAGGRMAELIERARTDGKTVMDRFQIAYKSQTKALAYDLSGMILNPAIQQAADDCIIHWTRSANGKWPTEPSLDYYRAIASAQAYPRSAFDTLKNIVQTQTIAASRKHMPGGIACVSFSDLAPVDVIPLMRWRARYRQMSFEPYGIGIARQTALEHGICPVQYYDRATDPAPGSEDAWKYQSVGARGNWTAEREYRHRSDFNLGSIPRRDLLLFCHTKAEADHIEKETGIRAVSFTL